MENKCDVTEGACHLAPLVAAEHTQMSFEANDGETFDPTVEYGFRALKGRNPDLLECVHIAKVASLTTSNVLLTGDTGTGKELMAKAIHAASVRKKGAFVPIECVAIPKELIASELFGYEEGSFTGARKCGKIGKFEVADGGTLFLDEIGEMPIDLQACLLRSIEEKEIYRIGGTQPIRLDVRLIAATNKDLAWETGRVGSFRKDLYYRLSVFHIHLPRLADRLEDIPLLAEHFLNHLNVLNAANKVLTDEAVLTLMKYPWPGNIRELANVIERAFYLSLSSRKIRAEDLPLNAPYPQSPPVTIKEKSTSPAGQIQCQPVTSIKENEKQHIQNVLVKCGYNVSRTARLLSISRSTLYRKLKEYRINRTFQL